MINSSLFISEDAPEIIPADAVYLIYHGDRLLTDMRAKTPLPLPAAALVDLETEADCTQFLGYWQGKACYAMSYQQLPVFDPMSYQLGSLYPLLGRVSDELFALAGRGLQIVNWYFDHQFCGRCGEVMVKHPSDRAMTCKPCKQLLYPRLSPAIIVLVTRGDEMLLARNHTFPQGLYSTLAGFVEPGETSEQCVVREVFEETNIRVNNVTYFGSQPWPFPSQLMLGFFASYESGDIVPQENEIADAQWFTAEKMPMTPPPHAISGQLIADFIGRKQVQ
ncbi:MAG: NAD+ diphosphatase [Halieaceae bacterium]|jgi:NAD+ diphosphatase